MNLESTVAVVYSGFPQYQPIISGPGTTAGNWIRLGRGPGTDAGNWIRLGRGPGTDAGNWIRYQIKKIEFGIFENACDCKLLQLILFPYSKTVPGTAS